MHGSTRVIAIALFAWLSGTGCPASPTAMTPGARCRADGCTTCCSADGTCVGSVTAEACGAEGNACTACSSEQSCSQGTCEESTCSGTLSRCAESCVDTTSRADHCGGCGIACAGGQVCRTGTCQSPPFDCVVSGCATGSFCDATTRLCVQGCRQSSDCPTGGSCNVAAQSCECPDGQRVCGAYCVSKFSTVTCGPNCLTCPVPSASSNSSPSCDGQVCGVACNPGYHLCSGQCVRDDSLNSCGTSCSPCPSLANATASCDGASCALSCNEGFHLCSGACVSDSSIDSCGTSCTPCPAPPANATATCNGTCDFSCNPGYLKCGAACCLTTAVSAGDIHTCALLAGGRAKCWGANYAGRLGDGTIDNRIIPTDVSGVTSGTALISSGKAHTCSIDSNGGAKCWGDNLSGQLGDGTRERRLQPTAVSGLSSGTTAIALATGHTCALISSGAVKCWGENAFGQLGDGTTTDRLTPADVVGLSAGGAGIAAGGEHVCVLTAAGGVNCWGSNAYGQLGDGTTTFRTGPVDVTGLLTGVTAIAAGGSHTCALTSTGGVKCWGSNAQGRLGDGTTIDRHTPVDVSALAAGVTAIAAGGLHSCALMATGGVKCWGNNAYGQLGDGTGIQRLTPVDVSGMSSAMSAITAGGDHSCALAANGGLRCWGSNSYWQVGDGTDLNRLTPVFVTGR